MLRALVVPHAPLLIDTPGRPHPVPGTLRALRELPIAPHVVVVTPHAPTAGVYHSARGDLGGFGLRGCELDVDTDESTAATIAEAWNGNRLDGPLDHGALVPLTLLKVERAVVCGLPAWTGQEDGDPSEALKAASDLAAVLREAAHTRDLTVVASGHTSAAVTPRAPLQERPEGIEVDAAVRAALASSPQRLATISPSLWRRAGSCGAAPLHLLGELGLERFDVTTAAAPFGVGYVVARSAV